MATRYHSLVVDPASVPDVLEVTATTAEGVVMGFRHRELAVEGVQFHPESVLTASGPALLDELPGRPRPGLRVARRYRSSSDTTSKSWKVSPPTALSILAPMVWVSGRFELVIADS